MKRIATKIFAVTTALTSLVIMAAPQAQAVAFNTFPISYTAQTNMDYPMIDARNITAGGSFSVSQADHDNGVAANAGDIVEFQIYYHNSDVPENVANNVIVQAGLPGGSRASHVVSASIRSDQTSAVSSSDSFRGGNVAINISGSNAQTMEFIPGSVKWFPNRGIGGSATPVGSPDSLVSSGLNIGTIKGCFEFSGFVSFRAQVGNSQPGQNNYNLNITKNVLDVSRGEVNFLNSTTASPSELVRFQVRVDSNSSNAAQNNVIVRDVLPTQFSRVVGSLRQDGASVGNEADFFGSGLNLGALSAGTTRTFTFDANVAGVGAFSGYTTLTNTANVRSDQVGTKQADAKVNVNLPTGGASFVLRKTAFNITQGVDATTRPANPGDVIVYNLYYRNTGTVTNSSVVIVDDISSIKQFARVTDQGNATHVNGSINYAPVDVPAGVEVSRSFQVTINPATLWPTTSSLVMTNVYGNTVSVTLQRPGTPPISTTPPRTGAGEWLMGTFAALTTAGYWLYQKQHLKLRN